jgi:hypothetical protein
VYRLVVLEHFLVLLVYLVNRLEAGVGYLGDGELFVVGLLGRDDGGVGDEREVDSGIGNQVGLELGQVNVESSVESEKRNFNFIITNRFSKLAQHDELFL